MATTPYPFVAATVLTALQLNSTFNIPTTTLTASHTLIAADAGTRVYMNSASATTITVNTSIFSASDVVEIFNIGAGVTTLTAGTATVSSAGPLAIPQYGSGRLTFTAAGASIYTPSAVTATASGLTLISTTTIGTTVDTVTVSSAFSATYDAYKIVISGGVASESSPNLSLSLGATTTGYYYGLAGTNYANTANTIGGANQSAFNFYGAGSTNTLHMNCDIMQPNLAKNTIATAYVGVLGTGGAGNFLGGFLNDSTQYTAFTVTPSAGTITGGTIRVYGYQNS